MHSIDDFSLHPRHDPDGPTGQTSRLLRAGTDTGTELPGYVLDAQYQHDGGYLFVTSWDCLFEESLTVSVTDPALRIVAQADISVPYATVWLERHEATAEGQLLLYCNHGDYRISVTPRLRVELRAKGEDGFRPLGGLATSAGLWRRLVRFFAG